MVVLSAAVLSKRKYLVSRQFVEMTKLRVEGLLSAFLKLIEMGGKDHTYIETESVRYVYQPMESLYLLLITNKSSNILEDLETLRLLQQIVQNCCVTTPVQEEQVCARAFDIIFAFDEVISFGHRESVSLSQIQTYTEMESHEEKLQDIIRRSKEQEEADRRKQIASKLDKERAAKRREERERERAGLPSATDLDGLGRSVGLSAVEASTVSTDIGAPGSHTTVPAASGLNLAPKRGMQIGKAKGRGAEIFGSVLPAASSGVAGGTSGPPSPELSAPPAGDSSVVNPLLDPVNVLIEEKVTADLMKEGGVNDLDIQGAFIVTVIDPAKADLVSFQISPEDHRFKYLVHPNLNKASQAKGVLEVRDPRRPFRKDAAAQLLRWRWSSGKSSATSEEEIFPLSVSCWPSSTTDGTLMTVEIELLQSTRSLLDVTLHFPLPKGGQTNVEILSTDVGSPTFTSSSLQWNLPLLDATNSHVTLEFQARSDAAVLFPFTLDAVCFETVCSIDIQECFHMEKKTPIVYSLTRKCLLHASIGG